jgi:hypothetical protein
LTATSAAALAARDTSATAADLEVAAEAGRRAGREWHRTGQRQHCPYHLGTLTAHVWIRWAVHERLTAAGMPE